VSTKSEAIVLFDGFCNLCCGSVDFLLKRDRKKRLRFATLQSDAAREIVARADGPSLEKLSSAGGGSIVLVEGDRLFTRSTAALRCARHLRFPWPVLAILLVVPRFLRDPAYDLVARNRYRWFGRRESCRVPSPEESDLFLS
jgi:predicted DCC family thiol-disulfide oxidoreductase YuxK